MLLRYPRRTAYGITAALVAVLLGLFVEARLSAAAPHVEPGSDLIVSTRDRLRVCADIRVSDERRVADQLTEGLKRVRRHPHWGLTDFGAGTPLLERGCSAQLPETGVSKGIVIGPGVTERPGPFRTIIVVLGDQDADRYLGDQRAALVPYELMELERKVTATVTQAVVVRDSFIGSPGFVKDYLTPAIGLHPDPDGKEDQHDDETA